MLIHILFVSVFQSKWWLSFYNLIFIKTSWKLLAPFRYNSHHSWGFKIELSGFDLFILIWREIWGYFLPYLIRSIWFDFLLILFLSIFIFFSIYLCFVCFRLLIFLFDWSLILNNIFIFLFWIKTFH